MKSVIHKYAVMTGTKSTVLMPRGAKMLHVSEQHGELAVWALVDPLSNDTVQRSFHVYPTGSEFLVSSMEYVGTYIQPSRLSAALTWHVFVEEERS